MWPELKYNSIATDYHVSALLQYSDYAIRKMQTYNSLSLSHMSRQSVCSQHIDVCYYQIFMTIKMIIIHRWKFVRSIGTFLHSVALFDARIAIE